MEQKGSSEGVQMRKTTVRAQLATEIFFISHDYKCHTACLGSNVDFRLSDDK